MKKILAMLLAILALCACSAEDNKSAGLADTEVTDTEAVTMTAEAVSNAEIALTLTNNSNWVVGYGEPYHIEFEKNGEWHILETKEEAFFTMPLYILEAGQSNSWNLNVSYIYGELAEGKYRVVKSVSIYRDANDYQSSEDMTLAAEFKIS